MGSDLHFKKKRKKEKDQTSIFPSQYITSCDSSKFFSWVKVTFHLYMASVYALLKRVWLSKHKSGLCVDEKTYEKR